MRTAILLVTASLVVPAPAVAQGRPDTRQMTCAEAQSLVARNGAVVMTTGPQTFERFVTGFSYCQVGEQLSREVAPTRDNRRCEVGFTCVIRNRVFNDGLF